MSAEEKTTTVAAVLLIPDEGHEDLLAEGPCGARPPMACWQKDALHEMTWGDAAGEEPDPEGYVQVCIECAKPWPCADAGAVSVPGRWRSVTWLRALPVPKGEALVLKWEGEILWSGIDRLRRHPPDGPSWANTAIIICSGAKTSPIDLPGTLILLDADGREVKP